VVQELQIGGTRLDCAAIVRAFGIAPRPWREALEETIDRMPANRDLA